MSGTRKSSGGDDTAAKAREIPLKWQYVVGWDATEKISQRTGAAYHVAGCANRLTRISGTTIKRAWVDSNGGGLVMSRSRSGMNDQELRKVLEALVAGQAAECLYLWRNGYTWKEALQATNSGANHGREMFKKVAEGTGVYVRESVG